MHHAPSEPSWNPATFPPAARNNRLLQTLLFNRNPLGELMRARREHGPVFVLRILPYRAGLVCATDTETNRAVLTDSERFAAGDAAAAIEPIVGAHSLILTPAPQHARNRKLLMPPFHGTRINRWADEVRALTEAQLPGLLSADPVAVRPWAQRLTLDVILRVVFGIEEPQRRDTYRTALDRIMDPRLLPILFAPAALRRDLGPLSPGGAFARRRAAVDALLYDEIRRRRAEPDAGDRVDVLSVLLSARDEAGAGYDDEQVRDELLGLVLAGHETTATALAWTVHLLAQNPRVRDRLVEEVRSGSGDNTYLAATIKESMRLRSPVIDAVRIATRDTELSGLPVPAGAFVSAMFSAMHLDEDLWGDPLAFRPERHLETKLDTWSLTPFGGGARRCLGAALAQLELEVVLREVLARSVPEAAGPPEAVRLLGVTLVPAAGGRVRMTSGLTSGRTIDLAADTTDT